MQSVSGVYVYVCVGMLIMTRTATGRAEFRHLPISLHSPEIRRKPSKIFLNIVDEHISGIPRIGAITAHTCVCECSPNYAKQIDHRENLKFFISLQESTKLKL